MYSRETSKARGRSKLPTKIATQGDPEWANMMEFFKANPAALMDALPTPPGSEEDRKSVKGRDFNTTFVSQA